MKSLIAARTPGIARTGLAMAALALAGCSTDNPTNPLEVAGVAVTAPNGAHRTPASPHVLYLEDADGKTFKLVHSPGYGWRYFAGQSLEDGVSTIGARKVELSAVTVSYAENGAPISDPIAVFVDGPTGYTFTWNADTGWTFVGHIRNERP